MPITQNELGTQGTIVWPAERPVWRFDYWLSRPPDAEALVIWQAFFRGRLLLYKASLPMIRVQYDDGYLSLDRLDIDTAQWMDTGDARRPKLVGVYQGFSTTRSQRYLVLTTYHLGGPLGAYRIMQKWFFYEDGVVHPHVASGGVNPRHKTSHRHHAYWRLDFDIEGAGNDIVLEHFRTGTSRDRDEGFGIGWSQLLSERGGRRIKDEAFHVGWAVMDGVTGRGCQVVPGTADGFADAFGRGDLWAMRYHPEEDTHGHTGTPQDEGLQVFLNNNEALDRTDVVVWYCAHLYHRVDAHHMRDDELHAAGPWLFPFRY